METGDTGMSVAIEFANVGKVYTRQLSGQRDTILQGFNFEIKPGELVALVGPSGIGKTTLLHIAAGLEQPDTGTVAIGRSDKPARIGMVFQQPRLLDWRTVKSNIDLVAKAAGQDLKRGAALLAAVGLADYAEAFPLALSGGQRQRVALARAFAIDPEVLLLDEPFSALDELTARRLRLLLQDLWRSAPPTGLLVTHNMLEAAFLADRVIVLGQKPARIVHTIDIDVPRPRQPEDPALFEAHREIIAHLA
jgi:ABC-type nitrate/sulfonate/bicarbonate transport system ATPase subunit